MLISLGNGTLAVSATLNRKETDVMNISLTENINYDVIVVGGSYAGLSAAMQLVRARRRVLIIDAQRPRNRFAHASHGFFGQDGRSPKEMIETARKQVLAYPTAHFERAEATQAVQEKNGFTVTFGEKNVARARRLVQATGIKDHLPDLPGMKELWGTGVAHCPYCHGYEVAERKIAVFSFHEPAIAIHQALLLRDWSDDITLLTNGRAVTNDDRERLRRREVKIEDARVSRLIARDKEKELEAVEFADGRRLPFGAMFTATRWTLTSPIAAQLGCEIETGTAAGPLIKTDAFKETTILGVYAAGDTARLYGNASLASADGVIAGGASHQSLIFPKTSH